MKKYTIHLTVNGEKHTLEVYPNALLLNVIREDIGLTGTKYACGTGQCGACTVEVNGEPVLGCMTLAVAVDGAEIKTIEGLAQPDGTLDPKRSRLTPHSFSSGSSIYMPDQKVTMLPLSLADNLCSLKLGKVRPAISMMAKINGLAEIIDVDFFLSLISIKNQLTYQEVNLMADQNREIIILHDIAQKFRKKRLSQRAVQITLPEIDIWINEEGEPSLNKTDRESPGRMLVSELMIMANWLMAQFLAKHNVPAIYRGQPEPRERLYSKDGGTLFQNWMQRKSLSRFVLSPEPNPHSGLGLDVYVTATSPIRKYFDLITQRQFRAICGFEVPYSKEEIEHIIQMLGQLMIDITHMQNRRNRYWLLKYLEKRIGQKEEAIVLYKRRNGYMALLGEYMIECQLPAPSSITLRPEDRVQVTMQHVNARNDIISVFIS